MAGISLVKIYDISRNGQVFDFMDGPPFVTGKLHMGHLAIGSIKSAILNYKSMSGYSCNNKLGYDCHGVPIESIANKELDIKSSDDLERIGIVEFNNYCKKRINDFERDWEPIYNRIGRLANFNDVYKTMDVNFMESIWWAFSSLYEKGLVYRGYKVVAYSYPLQSPLSNSEESQNYKDISTKTVYVRFKITNHDNTYIVAWTTTPWTLVANLALCVNKDLDYEYVMTESGDTYIVGKDKHKNCGLKVTNIIKTVKGSELVGLTYEPIYNYYNNDRFYHIVCDNYVQESGTNGTNIVHLAPTFGEDDYRVCMEKNIVTNDIIAELDPIDKNCKYNSVIACYAGMLVFDAEQQIFKDLKEKKSVVKIQSINHQYPHCYRTDTPLIYRTCESFYINVQKIKDRMIELNKEINWIPENIGSGRFYQWLENAHDWCVSRTRFFGTPIPVWISDNGNLLVMDSINKLQYYSGVCVTDLHPEQVNMIEFDYNGQHYKRVKDVFDCWFESGCVPFAQHHYPFENKEYIDSKKSMSEFIAEGVDQTRGWFYTLMVLSVGLFDKKPADNIMVVGHVLGENGKKISKKDGNYIDANILIDKYGADAIRLYLLQSPLSYAEPLAFKESDLQDIKQILYRFKNAAEFLKEHTHHMKLNNIDFDKNMYINATNPMDCWILAYFNQCDKMINTYMNNYNISKTVKLLIDMIENITNWYLKFNRDRFKGKCGNEEWIMSTSVLNYVVTTYIKLLTPFAPFTTADIHKLLCDINNDNTHLLEQEYTNKNDFSKFNHYLKSFELLQRISRLVRAARITTPKHTSTKTPIKSCTIYLDSLDDINRVSETIDSIQSELNIINIEYKILSDNITYRVVGDRASIGKQYKTQSRNIMNELEKIVLTTKTKNDITLNIDNKTIIITENQYTTEPIFEENDYFDKDIMTKIDFTYDESIQKLYHLKKFVSEIQQLRKKMGLHVWNKISIEVANDELGIVQDNIDFIVKRLECEVNINSLKQSDQQYISDCDIENSPKIMYSVFIY